MKKIKKLISLASAAAVTASLFAGLSASAEGTGTGYSYDPDTGIATWDFTATDASTTAATNGLSWGNSVSISVENGIQWNNGWVGDNYRRYIQFTPSSSGTITVNGGINADKLFITLNAKDDQHKYAVPDGSGVITAELNEATTYYIRSEGGANTDQRSVKSITYDADKKYYTESGNTSTWDFTAFGLTVDNVTTKHNGLQVHYYSNGSNPDTCTVSPESGVHVNAIWCGVSDDGVTYNRSIEYKPTVNGEVKIYTDQGVSIYKNNCVPTDENKIAVTKGEGYATAELKAGIKYYIEFDAAWTVSKVEFTEKTETEEPEEPTESEKPTANLTDAEWTVDNLGGYEADSTDTNKLNAPDGTEVYGYKATFSGSGDNTSYKKVTATVKKKDGSDTDIKTQYKEISGGITLNGGGVVFYIISNAELDMDNSSIVLE